MPPNHPHQTTPWVEYPTQAQSFFSPRPHSPTVNSYSPGTGPPQPWTGDRWVSQPVVDTRPGRTLDSNRAASVSNEYVSYFPHPAAESERVVWVHQDSMPSQEGHSLPMSASQPPQYVRVTRPGNDIRHRPQPYHPHPGSHMDASTHFSHDLPYQTPPTTGASRIGTGQPERQALSEDWDRQSSSDYGDRTQQTIFSGRGGKESTASHRQRAHLNSERKRREAINTGIHAIREALPDATEFDTKAVILDKALQYISHLKSQSKIKENIRQTDIKTEND